MSYGKPGTHSYGGSKSNSIYSIKNGPGRILRRPVFGPSGFHIFYAYWITSKKYKSGFDSPKSSMDSGRIVDRTSVNVLLYCSKKPRSASPRKSRVHQHGDWGKQFIAERAPHQPCNIPRLITRNYPYCARLHDVSSLSPIPREKMSTNGDRRELRDPPHNADILLIMHSPTVRSTLYYGHLYGGPKPDLALSSLYKLRHGQGHRGSLCLVGQSCPVALSHRRAGDERYVHPRDKLATVVHTLVTRRSACLTEYLSG